VLTPHLLHIYQSSFTNGTSIPFTVEFGVSFSTTSGAAAISIYDPADAFGNGDRYFIDNFGGQGTQLGTQEITTMTLNVVDPTALSQFLNGHFQGKYVDEAGMFTLTSLKFCVRGEPLQPGVCPAKDVQHWVRLYL
jgi:hypothetical protein